MALNLGNEIMDGYDFERGIDYARILATYYSELATRHEQEPEQEEGDE